MVQERQSQQDYFRTLLLTVVGQAFDAAGYHLKRAPLQWAGGKYRFTKSFEGGLYGLIDFQVLVYTENMWSSGMASRFRVQLTRSDDHNGKPTHHNQYATRTLSQLVVQDFGVNILPSADHWWTYRDTDSLGKGLAEAGHLIIGYGLPWLSGDLMPPPKEA
jgi:hypothetical protein